jgi:glycosyltransferase involved in cell wall biosynthesis
MSNRTRVLLVTDAVGGVWVYSLELARALKPFGVDAVLAVMGPSPSPQQRQEASAFELVDTGLPLDWLDTSPGELRRAGDSIAALATRADVQIVQTSSAALLAGSDFDQPCVAVQHSCVASWWAAVKGTPLPPEFRWRRELVERGLHRAALVVAPSDAFAAATATTYQLDAPVLAVHNGRRPNAAAEMPQTNVVLTVSRLWDEGKDVGTLERAAARLQVPFLAAGQAVGPNGAGISLQHIEQLGEVSADQVATLLAARPIFASAAVYEPFGLSVLEAASAGCALVLSDIPTHRELWEGAATFVRPRDDSAFAAAVEDLLHQPEKRQQCGARARALSERYSSERMARGMAELYAGLTAAAPAEMAGAA